MNRDPVIRYIERLEARIEQLERRMTSMIREGEILDVDYKKGLASMRAGDIETPMSTWLTRAGDVRDWNPVTKGERAIWISPTGDPGQGLIMPGGFSSIFPQNHNEGAAPRRSIGDYSFTESASGLVIKAGSVTYSFGADGFVQTGGVQEHDGRNVGSTHVHGGVVRGGSLTFQPQ